MKSRYPNILFHFTNDIAKLKGILADDFRLSHAREIIRGPHECTAFAIPMVSFCDLRFSEVAGHMHTYGKYGLGLSKEWANRNGLSPVAYWSKNSQRVDTFIRSIKSFANHLNSVDGPDEHEALTRSFNDAMDIYRFVKNYEGRLERGGEINENFRFANEREWRYVPFWEATRSFYPFSDADTPEKKQALNHSVRTMRLRFGPADIRYIIVSDEAEREEMIAHLTQLANDPSAQRPYHRLTERILTASQIEEDF